MLFGQHLSLGGQIGCRCVGRHAGRRRQYNTAGSSTIYARNSSSNDSNDYSKTIFVPKSTFPPKHNPKNELKIQEDESFSRAYLEQDTNRKTFVIHDGPPFANGHIHLGHTINKIFKDIAARHAMITGHRVEFITGWDCHGLPIEMQVIKLLEQQQQESNYGGQLLLETQVNPEEFRSKARSYAKSQIDLQMASFKRIGLLTDWNKRYTTDDPSYVANQLRAFSQLYEQKLVFKDLMPVNWSTVNRTTLAEADIEYRTDHISKSAYVMYQLVDPPFAVEPPGEPVYALIWTTTPWTLLENKAIGFNKQETYCLIKASNNSTEDHLNLLVSLDTQQKVATLLVTLGYSCEMQTYLPGHSLTGLKYKPRLSSLINNNECNQGKPLPFLHGDFVEGAKGTGFVHMAPNYGFDDFDLCRKHGISLDRVLVNGEGLYDRNETHCDLAGKSVFNQGNMEILQQLDERKALLSTEYTQHSYPYETRTNQPIIIRVSQQIFLDKSKIVNKCLKALESASIYPENMRRQLIQTLATGPNWCISRQRLWGTPIPVLYHAQDTNQEQMICNPLLVEHFCKQLYKRRHMDYWWTIDNSELIPQELLDKCKVPHQSDQLVRGTDIFDVWSDSGLSWHTTANCLNDSNSQADLYLEGVDQIRGWFSASSLLSIALRGTLPTKRFFLHGFALDERGRKMSKSQGNVVDPLTLFEAHGVDPVRLWAARSAGNNQNVWVKSREFKASISEMVNKTRLILKYLIGSLENQEDIVIKDLDHTKLTLFDQYYLDSLYRFASTVDEQYRVYRYDIVANEIYRFLGHSLSPIYLNTIKDVLYCDQASSERRKSHLTVLNITYNILLRTLYPLTPHIVHEAGLHKPPSEPLNEWQDLGYKASWRNDVLHNQFETVVGFKTVMRQLVGLRYDELRSHEAVLLLSDKKLCKHLSKVANSESGLMGELFRTASFVVSHQEQLPTPDGVEERQHKQEVSEGAAEQQLRQQQQQQQKAPTLDVRLESYWSRAMGDELRLGGSVAVGEAATPTRFEARFRRSSNRKCVRCRRFAVLPVSEQANICDRCRDALDKLEQVD